MLGSLGYLNQISLESLCAKFQLPSWSRSAWKVCCGGGVVGYFWRSFNAKINSSSGEIHKYRMFTDKASGSIHIEVLNKTNKQKGSLHCSQKDELYYWMADVFKTSALFKALSKLDSWPHLLSDCNFTHSDKFWSRKLQCCWYVRTKGEDCENTPCLTSSQPTQHIVINQSSLTFLYHVH